ncbi:dNA polymerase III delta subunit [Clostridium sp. CAG:793]|jgi:DNA polymerase-3 subunit delta|nr:dNA polymerase III delta subunit [Clostridium sp. CAG:793]
MVYLLYGEDNYLKNEFVKKAKKSFGELQLGINYIQIDESNVNNVISDIETPAFGYERKMIIVKNANLMQKKNAISDKLSEYLNDADKQILDSIELIIVEDSVEKNALFNTISKIGMIKEFNEQKISQLITKVKSISAAYGVQIQENVAQYFIECTGTNMEDIINEIRKLIEYAGKGGTIKKEDIDSLTIKKSESVIFDLTDNLGKKNIHEAINVLHDLIYAKEPVQKILVMLYNHFKKLYIVQLSNGQNVAQNLKLKPNQTFLVSKYQNQAKFFTQDEIRNLLNEFMYIDEASKSGNLDINVGLESVLCRYCA